MSNPTPIPTIFGLKTPDHDDLSYMDYLDNIYDAPDYGLLLFKGDPIAFEQGKRARLNYLKEGGAK
jgi:hypothetical protein